jgi:proteasome lid subunit RPN8/RPN11
MEQTTQNDFIAHARLEYPRECCGIIAIVKGRERYFLCENKAVGTDHFTLSPEDYANVEEIGEVVAICHSHPDVPSTPSQADRVGCEASQLVWHILRVDALHNEQMPLDMHIMSPIGYIAPLVGRPFAHGVMDCYAIVKDWYKQERQIELPNFKRADDWWEDGTSDLYTQGFPVAGFERVGHTIEDCILEIGDVLLMQVRSKNLVPNHAAIYIGDSMILHHMHGRLSSRDIYGGMWQDYTVGILRYKGLA